MNTEVFIKGERKYISYRVQARDSEAEFLIRNCSWQLIKQGVIESEGEGEIDGHLIHVLIEPKEAHKYYSLVITYSIANQELKEITLIEVVDP